MLLGVLLLVAVSSAGCENPGGATHPEKTRLGVQLHPLWSNASVADFDRELDMAKSAGADTVRMDLGWSSLETAGKGLYAEGYVAKADTFFEHAQARGIRVIVTLLSTPCWASTAPTALKQGCAGKWWERGVDLYPPAKAAEYADAAAWVARRWGRQMEALEVWNEPNLDNFLRSHDPARDYAAILKAAYPRIKAADRSITVLGGALASSDGAFLTALYGDGIKGSYDAISYHPYSGARDPARPGPPDERQHSYQRGSRWIRDIMVAHGDGAAGMWQTEVGFSTCSLGTRRGCVTERQQARYTDEVFSIAREKMPYVKAVIAYNLRNKGSDPADAEAQFGLLRRDFTPKPAYEALKGALKR